MTRAATFRPTPWPRTPFPSTINDHNSTRKTFLDAEEAAAFLGGLNSRTITRWAREGFVPAYPLGEGKRRLWRFRENDLESWMLSRRNGQITSDPERAAGTLTAATDAPTGGNFQ